MLKLKSSFPTRPPMWCYYQLTCRDWPTGWAGGAHLGEGHVFRCPYTPDDIADVGYADTVRMKPCRNVEKYEGVCEDYEPLD